MSAPSDALVDPQLQAFWDSDPSLLRPPTGASDEHTARLALEIAAAAWIALRAVRVVLGKHQATVADGHALTRAAWRTDGGVFGKLVRPAIMDTLSRDPSVASMPEVELAATAAAYTDALGDYIGDSSADAFMGALNQQVSAGVDPSAAWVRATAGYGMDNRDMRSFIATLLNAKVTSPTLVGVDMVRVAENKVLARVERIGHVESFSALEQGKAMAWMYAQRAGRLPAEAMREWRTAEDESTCPICGPFDGAQVGLQDWFVIDGMRLLAPRAHPGCRCRVKLVLPELDEHAEVVTKARGDDPYNRTPGGKFAHTEQRNQQARVAEREQLNLPTEVAPDFGQPALDFGNPDFGNPDFGTPVPDFGTPNFGQPALDFTRAGSPQFARTADAQAASKARQRTFLRRVIVPSMPAPKATGVGEFYLPSDEYHLAAGRGEVGKLFDTHEDVDFSQAQHDYENGTLRAVEATNPWALLDRDMMMTRRNMGAMADGDDVADAWYRLHPRARQLWEEAVDDPDKYLERLMSDPGAVMDIAQMGGLDVDTGQPLAPFEIAEAIRHDLTAMERGEQQGLGPAYADYMVWQAPQLMGLNGSDFGVDLDALRDQGHYLADEPVEQVLSFDKGWVRPGDHRITHAVPTGDYTVTRRTYRSAINDWKIGTPPPLHIGLQVAHVLPYSMENGMWVPTRGEGTPRARRRVRRLELE